MNGTRPIVVLTNPIHRQPAAVLAQHAEVRVAPATDAQTLIGLARDADVIIVRAPLSPQSLPSAHRLRGLIRHGAGLDLIPVAQASALGIAVANVPQANAQSVAEYAVGQILSLTHRLRQLDATLRADGWPAARSLADGAIEVAGKVVGIVGAGAIGQAVAHICHAGLGARVLGVRHSNRPMPQPLVAAGSLPALFEAADVIVLACPLNDQTRGMVGRELLSRMKRGAFLVNVSRGPVIDEPALVEALQDGRLGGAALDVFVEQPLPAASPLLTMPNVILSAHVAGITEDSMLRMGQGAVEQALQLLRGELPRHWTNTEAREKIAARLSRLNHS
jgi:D-3-phosphoglycerate dehydrogenase